MSEKKLPGTRMDISNSMLNDRPISVTLLERHEDGYTIIRNKVLNPGDATVQYVIDSARYIIVEEIFSE